MIDAVNMNEINKFHFIDVAVITFFLHDGEQFIVCNVAFGQSQWQIIAIRFFCYDEFLVVQRFKFLLYNDSDTLHKFFLSLQNL